MLSRCSACAADQRGFAVEDAQHRAVRGAAQRPLPVVVGGVGFAQVGDEALGFEESVEGEVEDEVGAGGDGNVLAHGGQESGGGDAHEVASGKEAGDGEIAVLVGECGLHGAQSGAGGEDLNGGAHLRMADGVAHGTTNGGGVRSGRLARKGGERREQDARIRTTTDFRAGTRSTSGAESRSILLHHELRGAGELLLGDIVIDLDDQLVSARGEGGQGQALLQSDLFAGAAESAPRSRWL